MTALTYTAVRLVSRRLERMLGVLLAALLTIVPQLAYAQSPCPSNGYSLCDPLGNITLIGFFNSIVNVLLVFAVPLVVFFIMYAGFLYVTAQGNPNKIKDAHNALLYAIIGGVLILGAHALLIIVQGTVSQFTN